MNINLLAISIGNTRTRLGVFVDDKLTESDTFENASIDQLGQAIEDAFAPLRERDDAVVLMSSVRPQLNDQITKLVIDHTGQSPRWVEKDVPIPIGRRLDPEAMVGEDRLLNAAAAFDVMKQSCIVVDAGTAITIDLVDGEGTFHGGAIAPGASMMLESLNRRTAQLPDVSFGAPVEAIGHNTTEAMRVGVFYGLRGMVREITEQYAETIGQFPLVIATGGDGNLLFREYELVDRVVPNLTLMGIAVTLRRALESDQSSSSNE